MRGVSYGFPRLCRPLTRLDPFRSENWTALKKSRCGQIKPHWAFYILRLPRCGFSLMSHVGPGDCPRFDQRTSLPFCIVQGEKKSPSLLLEVHGRAFPSECGVNRRGARREAPVHRSLDTPELSPEATGHSARLGALQQECSRWSQPYFSIEFGRQESPGLLVATP